ncbi:hypothetical protein CCAX7_14640 [Capsulimonas corticalis]|uniref:ParB-like N-terminal domain-containing protein n=1 Tax=Capsulimonas corticalis TaxID=2219043 RepID=A0A402CZI7_9BACT|nr:ParB N-terminal domain-containing protein [Capsulimonas corticalis]BDI29413.1 hypothetical protein CCAX7_14640 [Capsulimonas corticalis]
MPRHLSDAGDFDMVEIGRLIEHPRNVNQGDYGAIESSMKANGFFGALVVQRSTRFILAGNHRYKVAKGLGYDRLPVMWVDVDDEAALRILLADNRTSRLGTDNEAALAELLSELAQETDEGLEGTGYDGDFLDDLINRLAGLDSPPGAPEPDEESPKRKQLGVFVLCSDEDEQEHVSAKITDIGWNSQRITVDESILSAKPPRARRRS